MHKRIIIIVAAVTAVAALIVPATSVAGHGGPHPLVFCINNMNVSEGQDIVPFTRLLPGAMLDPIILNDASAVLLRFFINKGGQFRLVDKAGNVATEFNTVSEGACAAAPRFVPLPARGVFCAAGGNTHPFTGRAIAPGTTLDLLVRQPESDVSYKGATPANFVDGVDSRGRYIGLTCDPPPAGFVRRGTAGAPQNVSAEPGYPLWVRG